MTAQLLTPKETYTVDYPEAVAYAEMQDSIFWTASEIEMSKDQSCLHNLTEAEMHGVTTVLKLFTLYELHVGNEYWLDYVRKKFPRPEVQRMASVFGMFELNVHAPFYNKLNELCGINTDDFYSSYKHDKVLKARMDWIDRQFEKDADPLVVLAIGSITEGAILYSNLAYLKHSDDAYKNVSYIIVVAGSASRTGRTDRNYSLSYQRAYSLYKYWRDNLGIDFDAKKYHDLIELQIAGNGTGGVGRLVSDDSGYNRKNQRFIINIIPKLGEL